MAKIRTSALVDQVTGSVGAVTFSKNRYGPVTRARIAPVNPNTPRQAAVRATFGTASKGWASLSATQQAAWNAFAAAHPMSDRLGESRILSGNALYTQVTANRALVGLAAVTTPPATGGLFPAAATIAAAVAATGIVTVTTAAQTVSTGWYLISTTPGLSTGSAFAGSKSRLAGAAVATTGAATTATATPPTYNAKLGFTTGSVVIVHVARMDINGYVYDVVSYRVIAT